MVIVNLFGGLGNQMFQYAAGKALAAKYKVPLLVDLGDMRDGRYEVHNGFELSRVFGLQVEEAGSGDLRLVLGRQSGGPMRRLFRRPAMRHLRSRRFIVEPHFHYWHGIGCIAPPCYLHGYWQSEHYFEDIAQRLREDFSFRSASLQRSSLEWLDQVRSGNSVSVHVRRGDYARNPQASKFHGVLNPEYYLQALSHLTRKYGSLEVFVFSDDLEWVRGNIRFDAPTHYVEGNARDASHIDMLLMSNCAHNIIANSTFSWWAGWLNARPGRTVVAPLQWFADKATDTRDICPPWFDRV